MDAASNQIKGIALRNFRPILAKLAGDRVAGAVITELPHDVREGLRTVVPTFPERARAADHPCGVFGRGTARRASGDTTLEVVALWT